jgi:hypothetical protein
MIHNQKVILFGKSKPAFKCYLLVKESILKRFGEDSMIHTSMILAKEKACRCHSRNGWYINRFYYENGEFAAKLKTSKRLCTCECHRSKQTEEKSKEDLSQQELK